MPQISQSFGVVVATHRSMITLLAATTSLLSFRIRSRTSLELEVMLCGICVLIPQQTFKEINGRPDSDASDDQKQLELAVSHGAPILQHPFPHIGHHGFEPDAEELARGSCKTLGGWRQRNAIECGLTPVIDLKRCDRPYFLGRD
jgi:hypothetical protein